jgi:hypothetical protein
LRLLLDGNSNHSAMLEVFYGYGISRISNPSSNSSLEASILVAEFLLQDNLFPFDEDARQHDVDDN